MPNFSFFGLQNSYNPQGNINVVLIWEPVVL
jgi:hypothetical protein